VGFFVGFRHGISPGDNLTPIMGRLHRDELSDAIPIRIRQVNTMDRPLTIEAFHALLTSDSEDSPLLAAQIGRDRKKVAQLVSFQKAEGKAP
jgi:hypothetical protein